MKILGIDPGKTTGLALLEMENKKLTILSIRESKDETAVDFLPWIDESDVIVLEAFLLRPNNARTGSFDWSDMVAPRVIGSVTTLATLRQKELVIQQPSIKPVGFAWANLTYKKGRKGTHQQDAVAHAVYYAVTHYHATPLSGVVKR